MATNFYHGNTFAPTLARLIRVETEGRRLMYQPSAHPRIRYRHVSAVCFAACYFASPEAMAASRA